MPSESYRAFERRLALVAYYRWLFGVGDPSDRDSVRSYHRELNRQPEGYDAEGRSHVQRVLAPRVREIEPAELLGWDQNVRRHTDSINRGRSEPITLKYFQVLAALKAEHYLDRTSSDADRFLNTVDAWVKERNRTRSGIDFPRFGPDDLNKIAYWMATGSGKTLLMHLNYHQYLHYRRRSGEPIDHILLVTPNAGLSEQHMAEMRKSGIPCRYYAESAAGGLFTSQPDAVTVIEITKLVEEKTGEGVRVETSAFEGRNLVFVDEGHKGSGKEAGEWRSRRAELAARGFTFEYSATFGQAVSGSSTSAALKDEYGRAILVDYSYPRFYDDGYGKDYRILNLESDFNEELTRRYQLANLLTFYEQAQVYAGREREFFGEYNLMAPLMLFIGHTVKAGKTRSQLSNADRQSLSDVQGLVGFLARVLENDHGWVPEAIDAILAGQAGLEREDGSDLFADAFPALRESGLDGRALYADLLERLFHVDGPAALHLVDLKTSEGEIGLRAGASDRFFGVINIGDDRNFLKTAEEKLPAVAVEESAQQPSLFRAVNTRGSPVRILVGAKKFIEGWSSWRVSAMGLMNIGRGEGPQIIQLFGRGVRLKGRGGTLKRSSELEGVGPHPEHIRLLETLNIFGVRADYMAAFRKYLEDEGIDTGEREVVQIDTRVRDEFFGRGLLTIRPETDSRFEDLVRLPLEADQAAAPEIDLTPTMEALVSDEANRARGAGGELPERQTIPADVLPLLDWERIFREIWQFRERRGYDNLLIERGVLREIVERRLYRLVCPPELLECDGYADLRRIEALALMILRTYIAGFFGPAKRAWEQEQLAYVPLDEADDNVVRTIEARVARSEQKFLEELRTMREDVELYEADDGLPPRVHFDRHLYVPLVKEDERDDPVVKYTPPGLNPGEARFVRDLRDHLAGPDGRAFMNGRELYLLRNQSRGHGVGFMAGDERFFPDFILWVKADGLQHIAFIDPKGLLLGKAPGHPKVRFSETIKEYEGRLNGQSGREDVRLTSFLVSQTDFEELGAAWGIRTVDEMNAMHVFFPAQDRYIARVLGRIVEHGEG